MINIVKQHIKDNGYDNIIHFGLKQDNISEIKEQLQNDNGYIDVILDFNDIDKLEQLINNVPSSSNKSIKMNYIYETYICYKILKLTSITCKNTKTTIQEIEEVLFSGDYNKFVDMDCILYMYIERALKQYCEENNKIIRIHLFFDNIKDILLQQKINDLIFARQHVIFMGYTTKPQLLTYSTTNGSFIESPHDYLSYYSEEFAKKIKIII